MLASFRLLLNLELYSDGALLEMSTASGRKI